MNLPFPLRVDHIPLGEERSGKKIKASTITIHSNANLKSTDTNERNNLARPGHKTAVSFHLAIDDDSATEILPWRSGVAERAWHATDGVSGPGNNTSLAVEICESGDRKKTLRNASILVANMLHVYGWGVDKVVQHNKWYPKNCPRILRENPHQWPEFISMIQAELNVLKGVKPVVTTPKVETPKPVDHTPTPWAKASWEKACKKIGKDGKPIFDDTNPKEPLTREQAAVVFDRLGLLG